MLFESAKRMLFEADYPIGLPKGHKSNESGSDSKPDYIDAEFIDDADEYEKNRKKFEQEFGQDDEDAESYQSDQYTSQDFEKTVKYLYNTYKSILVASEKYIIMCDKSINKYINGEYVDRGKVLADAMFAQLNGVFKGTQKSLNSAIHNFEKVGLRNLERIVNTTYNKYNKKLYLYFTHVFKKMVDNFNEKTKEAFMFLKYVINNYISVDKKISKNMLNKWGFLSTEAKNFLSDKLQKFYKWSFEKSGTNKGFFQTIKDAFFAQMSPEGSEYEFNPYDGKNPNHDLEQMSYEGPGSTTIGHMNVFYTEENRLLNKIHDLTRVYIDSNFKNEKAKQEIEELNILRQKNRDKYIEQTNNNKLKAADDKLDREYEGWGAWNKYSQRPTKTSQPKDNSRNNYRSKDQRPPRTGYRQGGYDKDLEDYRREDQKEYNDYHDD